MHSIYHLILKNYNNAEAPEWTLLIFFFSIYFLF